MNKRVKKKHFKYSLMKKTGARKVVIPKDPDAPVKLIRRTGPVDRLERTS